ncbi:MAG: cation diffusion facilitator family transporter [Anaerolineales bacterium]
MNPHPAQTIEKRFLLALVLTGLVLAAEVLGGWWTNSLALLSDAAHVFMDVFALALSYLALRLSALPADDRHTYGYHRLEVFAALINGVTLGAIAIEIFREAWKRWQDPAPIKSAEMLAIAAVGLAVNLGVAVILRGGIHRHEHGPDLNVRSAYLHVLGDAISSVGVILAAALLWLTGWLWLDPLVSVLIGALIVVSSWRVLKSSLHILIEGVPEHLSLKNIGQCMAAVPGVLEVHDLHVWSICSGHIALSAHVVTANQPLAEGNGIMTELKARLARFGIEHTTIQFECEACGQGAAYLET